MGRPKRRRSDRAGRPAMRSPGRPPAGRREHRQRFWAAIARGRRRARRRRARRVCRRRLASGGFGRVAACRRSLRRRCRGAICRSLSGRRSRCCAPSGCGVREIARQLGRSPSTISRELRRNAATRGGGLEYRAIDGAVACRPARAAPEAGEAGRQRAAAAVCAGPPLRCGQRPDGSAVAGPEVRWIGRRHGRRKDRRWAQVVEPGADLPSAARRLPR